MLKPMQSAFRLQLGIVLALALVGGFLQPVEPAEAEASQAQSLDPAVLAPLVSPALEDVATTDPTKESGFEAAVTEPMKAEVAPAPVAELDEPVDVSRFDEDTSEVVSRGEFQQVYLNEDGSKTTRLSPVPLNVKAEDGKWTPVETTVGPVNEGVAEVENHPLDPQFADTASETDALTVSSGKYEVGFTLEDAADSSLELQASSQKRLPLNEVLYPNVFEGVDLAYEVNADGVKETLVLQDLPVASEDSWTWLISAPGLELEKTEAGEILFLDAAGAVKLVIPTPLMWDSSGVKNVREPAEKVVDSTLVKRGSDWAFTLQPDREWLADPDREYPVSVDPTTNIVQNDVHAYKSDGSNLNGVIRIGNTRENNTDRYWRTVLHYNYEQLFGKQVLGAALYGRYDGGGTQEGFWGSVHHATAFNYNGVGEPLSSWGIAFDGYAAESGLANRVAQWVRDQSSGNYLVLRGDEVPAYSYKTLATELLIDWKDFPQVTGTLAPTPTNGGRSSVTPTLTMTGSDPGGGGVNYRFKFSENPNPEVSTVLDSGAQGVGPSYTVPVNSLLPGKRYYWKVSIWDGYDGHLGTSTVRSAGPFSILTNTPAATPPQGTATPSNGQVITSLTPTLTASGVTDIDADPVKYQFRLATGTDGTTGAVVSSNWQTGTTWQVPDGVLQDGGAYTWVVLTDDGYDKPAAAWVNKLIVNQRIGDSGPAPTESAGPTTVNLANGNVGVRFSSPTVDTIGGPMGLSFSYNSLKTRSTGLTGKYYDATPTGGQAQNWDFTGRTPVLVRTDSSISFDWGVQSPGPALPVDKFMAQWTGFITVPTAGNYTFGAIADDGARVTVNGTKTLDRWTSGASNTAAWGTAAAMGVSPTPISVDYYEVTSGAHMKLLARTPTGEEFVVPPSWFTRSTETLPQGWSSSTALAGDAGDYSSAQVTEGSVVLTDSTGTTHTYTKKSAGGYSSPVGEYGVLSLDAAGLVTLSEEDGSSYVFNAAGRVESTSNPTDALKPAAPVSTYRPNTGQIDRISDPLSATSPATSPQTYAREVRFAYPDQTATSVGLSASDAGPGGAACRVPAGYTAAPPGMVCRIIYPGHVAGATDTTELFYDASGYLVRIQDPGSEITDFAYVQGKLSQVRDSLANDWLAADATRNGSGPVSTTIDYDSKGRAASVTSPAPDGVTVSARPMETFTYGAGTSFVDIAGLTVPKAAPANGHAKTVTFDSAYRQLTSSSASGLTGSGEWNEKDMALSSTTAQGLKSTSIYNQQDRLTDTYGPAPIACFGADRRPLSSCPIVPAHSSTSYDQGLKGLNAVYYNNERLAGVPVAYGLGIGVADGRVNRDWNAASPTAGVNATYWSARLTGLITFPAAGTYSMATYADDGAQVWIDDVLVADAWGGGAARWSPNGPVTVTAGQQSRIRVQYMNQTGPSTLVLNWTPPGGTKQPVPGSALTPDYGLATGSTVDDSAPVGVAGLTDVQVPSMSTATEYATPWLGAATTSIVDPSGLNLRTVTAYEAPGSGYLRRTSRMLPAGVASGASASTAGTTSAYYGAKETLQDVYGGSVCGVPASTTQSGFLRSTTGAAPAGGAAIVGSVVYDLLGRIVGSKSSGDTGWSCTTFDVRGRAVTRILAANDTALARTVTSDFASGGNPLVTWVKDGSVEGSTNESRITTTTDLLGRAIGYTDVWGTVTTGVHDLAGRVTSTSTTSGTTTSTQSFEYDADGNVEKVLHNGVVIADPVYSTANDVTKGNLASVTYPEAAGNGSSLSAITRNAVGATTGLNWSFVSGASVADDVVRSQSGRILRNTLTSGATIDVSTYSYDAAGRLIRAVIPGHTQSYGFGAVAGCATGSIANAGLNGNRTSLTDAKTAGATTTTVSCYDQADRLLSSQVTNPVAGANSVADGLPATELAYDAHGNTTTLGIESLAYDVADRHLTTKLTDDTLVKYTRDATDRIVARTQTPPGGPASTVRYSFSGDGDSPDLLLDSASTVVERTLSLPGGVTVSLPATGAETWSYPNVHGDTVVTADGNGLRAASIALYDPFGQTIDRATGDIGTITADDSGPNTQTATDADYGWLGQHQKLFEHAGGIATIEMGARQYVPALGRFLEVDPVEGGVENDYGYPSDPVNEFDLSGKFKVDWWLVADIAMIALMFVPGGALISAALKVASLAVRATKFTVDVVKAVRIVRGASRYVRQPAIGKGSTTASLRAATLASRRWVGKVVKQDRASSGQAMTFGRNGNWYRGIGKSKAGVPKVNFGRKGISHNFHVWIK
ncbi:PA14 domain-containing protein [Cryobacterium sp. LW097]|uniref:PA14 domain-containing protein n=1 Tax=Cryobacterium sp. LW097 TaxID=1978566 RepID=UPI00124558B5|nr:PA14 domain-containing protein [Cryobacterium sp. LW097]